MGNKKRIIQNRYLTKLGYTKLQYNQMFPGAPTSSIAAREAYRNAALSEKGRTIRSNTITKLNLENIEFQKNRKEAVKNFLESDRSNNYRKAAADKAKLQHQSGLDEHVKKYFRERYQGSAEQENRRQRMLKLKVSTRPDVIEKSKTTYIKNSNLGLHNKGKNLRNRLYKNTNLYYMSSYEFEFLELCESIGILHRIKNGPCFTTKPYPYRYYQPDFALDDKYAIEIKSWFIENIQEQKHPGIMLLKEQMVIKNGYVFVYIKDKDYAKFLTLVNDLP